ncbi:MAG: T9SS type A sorting domain-containing protein [Bacteroidetes bacterium]|nr:T9SS type A sorting domain-containing protein [Bacteroidota bacterium]
MKHTAIYLLTVTLLLFAAIDARGQAGPPLGDDFIFFVNGTNTLVPDFNGNIIDDPTDPTNKIVEYVYGNWAFQAFRFPADVGVDLSQNRADGDVLHARIWVDPANAGMSNVQLMFEDKTDGSGADDGSADIPFRLVWRIPENMRDGEWHEVSIPLPPATYTELEDAKTAETLDGLDSLWKYVGGWSSGGFGVGVSDELGPNTMDNPALWKEFEWTNVQNLGVSFDNNTGGGTIYLDDVYIGAENLDLSVANDPVGAAMGVSVEATADSNMISWMSVDGADGYNVYSSVNEITDIKASGVSLAARLTGGTTSASHRIEVPHASLAPLTLYYAVTTLSGFGVENTDVSMSKGEVANENLPIQAHIAELIEAEVDHLNDLLFNNMFDNVVEDGFPDGYMPFELNQAHSKPGDGGQLTPDNDLSGKLWAGYGADPPELYLYVEVTDDVVTLQADGGNPADGWQHDSIEFGWGNYDVRDVDGGGIFTGSPHQDIMRGDFADYQFRLLGQGDGTKAGSVGAVFVGWSIDATPQGGGVIYDQLMDASGQATGYKILSVIPLDQIQNTDQMDAIVDLPTGSDVAYFPFNFVLNDGDGANRDNQIQWSLKGNADGGWWNTPAQWPAVALAGREAQGSMMRTEIELLEIAAGSAITTLSVDEAGSQTYYVKLTSEPSADVMVAITGQAGTDLTLDNDGDASTDFSGLTFTMQNWNAAQAVMMMAAVDGDGDDDMVTLMHTASSSDTDYDGKSVTLEVTVTDVTQTNLEDANELPKEIALDQNYPNPFNPSTSIRFALPESEIVTLRVYDSLGRPVATLLDQKPHTAGTHTVRFNGAGLASGLYLYRLEVGTSVLMTRHMQLIK